MTFSIPPEFGHRVNRLDDLLIAYKAEVDEGKKRGLLRLAMVTSCEILQSIDKDNLLKSIEEIEEKSNRDAVFNDIIANNDRFEYFLKNVENKAFEKVGINELARNRMISQLRVARQARATGNIKGLSSAIEHLKYFFCSESDILIAIDSNAQRQRGMWNVVGKFKEFVEIAHTPIVFVEIIALCTIVVDTALVSPLSLEGAHASIVLANKFHHSGG